MMIRQRLYAAILSVALVAAMTTSALAQSWNLYSGYTSLPTISFAGGSMSPTNPATVNLAIGGASSTTPFVMDTGSTGIVVSSDYFTPGPNSVYVGKGSQTYTSSGVVDNGSFYLTNVVIYNGSTPLATARVTVLDVTSQTCLPGYSNCTPNSDPTKIAYMGVGFDRGTSSTQPPAPYNNTNPFINIVSLASGQPVSSLAPGYMITNSGVTLGLSSSTTNGFAFVKLLPDTTNSPPQPAPAWLQAPVTISIGGKQSSGVILPDTGIDYAYLTPPPGQSYTTTSTNCKTSACLVSGYTLQVFLPGQTTPQPAFYTFTTGAPGNALQPNSVSLNGANSTAFLNTGREFYAGFDYVYDPVDGYVGYRWNGTVPSSFGGVTPSVALTGNVNLPAGFSSSLPTILYGPTTLLGAGAGTISSTISGSFGLAIGSGQIILTGQGTYTGSTAVNGGTLEVDGLIANTSSVTVNSGGTLAGTGTVDPPTTTIMNGGTLAPGNAAAPTGTLTIAGNLVFQSAAIYLITIDGASASKTSVIGGSAALSGAGVNVASGSTFVVGTRYTILTADGGVVGTFNPTVTYGAYTGVLGYDRNDVYLTVLPSLLPGAPTNVVNVMGGIDNYIGSGGSLPAGFQNLFNLSPLAMLNALGQLSGEAATGAERGAFQIMTQFLSLMLDPFVDGRNAGFGSGGAIGFAPEQQENLPPDVALAYASILNKAPPKPTFDQHWTTWGTAYGGSNSANGNAAVGSTNVTAQTFGFAAGMDYHVTPDTIFGFAFAGGGTNWGLANALGGGRSDALQAGVYGITHAGPAYLAAALAFTNHWFTTSRAALGDALTANFDGQSYGGRLEGGYRYAALSTLGVTPYGAVQLQDFHTPAYSETDTTGGGFGLSYNAMNATDVRTELGSRFDAPTLLYGKPLVLYGRVAWAHDFVANPALSAGFQALPGGTFTVNGAPIPQNSALTTAGAQLFLTPRWTLLAKFDGEFAGGSQTYAGSGTLRYLW
jgi:autotransporter-associated beta strand protein